MNSYTFMYLGLTNTVRFASDGTRFDFLARIIFISAEAEECLRDPIFFSDRMRTYSGSAGVACLLNWTVFFRNSFPPTQVEFSHVNHKKTRTGSEPWSESDF